MATSKRRSAERVQPHTEKPHPLLQQPAQQVETSFGTLAVSGTMNDAQRALIEKHRVEGGIKIDGRTFPRQKVEVIRSKRQQRGNQ